MAHLINDNGVQREMTADELANYEAIVAQNAASAVTEKARLDAIKSATAKLAALGLTQAEVAALIGA